MVVCVLIPRFELLAAVGTRRELLREAVALAPEPDRAQVVGEVSGAAQALGIHPGMRVGEALARCPGLRLIPPDPERAARAWEAVLTGAGGDRGRGRAGGAGRGVLRRRRPAPPVRRATWRACSPARAGRCRSPPAGARPRAASAPTPPRARARPGRGAKIVPAGAERGFLAPLPVSLLPAPARSRAGDLPLERLGIRTLGELAALPSGALADRFGEQGLRGRELAHGRDTALRPRAPGERLVEEIELPEAVSGLQLQRTLELLIDRLLASPRAAATARCAP